jgi:hypothetical protein
MVKPTRITLVARPDPMTADAIYWITLCPSVSPTWIWMQVAIVVCVLIGMVVAITKLA